MIQINLLRVSPDSQYLEFSVECPTGYRFNTLNVIRYEPVTGTVDASLDLSGLLQGTTTKEIMRIATSAIDPDVTMYEVEFGVAPINGEDPPIENATGVCSNINFVYANLLDLVMSFTNCCISDTQYDNLDRNYMILYAHQEAMRLERYNDAKYFYSIIWNLFVSCGPTVRQSNIINKPCNCSN